MIDKISKLSVVTRTSKVKADAEQLKTKSALDSEKKLLNYFVEEFAKVDSRPTKEMIETKIIHLTLVNMLGQNAAKEPKYKDLFEHIKTELSESNKVDILLETILEKLK